MFAKIINGGVIVNSMPFSGCKPLIETPYEERAGFNSWYDYVDTGENIITVWHYAEMTDSEEETLPPTDEQSLTRYINELTGGNDTDLVSAAETLIRNNMEE